MLRPALALSIALTASCAVEPALETTAVPLTDGCLGCGANSSVINGVHFYELAWSGEANSEGVRLLGFANLPNGGKRLDVVGSELIARNAWGTKVAWGPDLVGSWLILEVEGESVSVKITHYHRTLEYWAANDHTPLSSYTFEYLKVGGTNSKLVPLCNSKDEADGDAALDAFVFEGDRYDAKNKRVVIGPETNGWFNIACMGGAPAKMFRMRAAEASSNPLKGITTTIDERQSLFNMWIGNYCGDGKVFTIPGELLRVRDAKKWIPVDSDWSWVKESQLDSYEAVWGPDGAVCLDVPRRDDTIPGYRKEIADHCESVNHDLPLCSELGMFPNAWPSSGAYATANPLGS